MAGADVTAFVDGLRARLSDFGAGSADLNQLSDTAAQISLLLDQPAGTVTEAAWGQAVAEFEQARSTVLQFLAKSVIGPLADFAPLRDSIADVETIARTGLRASFDLGPVHVTAGSAAFFAQPPKLAGGFDPPPLAIGPFELSGLEAKLPSPLGGGGAGGGALVRLKGSSGEDNGWGGRLELPLPPVQVSASAVLSFDGSSPSFLAVLGIQFTPPIQLSFGFSLDRVGGMVGVNRTIGVEKLRSAIRTGAAADTLFQARPPQNPLDFATTLDGLFPRLTGAHILGPSLKLSWISFGAPGSLVSLDLAVIVEIPVGRVAILGMARMGIPSVPALVNFRIDLLGLIDPVEQLVSVDASLVDSHVLGIFEVYGDAAMRLSWGSQPYVVLSIGGFFPGFDPKPAKLPALRRVGMSQSVPGSGLKLRVEGYFAVTSNAIQLGGRIEASIDLIIRAHGFIEADALVQFSPFYFQARVAAGFSVAVDDFSFGSVQLSGEISGPGPIVVHGSLSISVFLFEISWDQSFSLGSGPRDPVPLPVSLLKLLEGELKQRQNLRTANAADPEVALSPGELTNGLALVPPTGALQISQRIAPLTIPLDRVLGQPLASKQGAKIAGIGADILDGFAPGSFLKLSDAEILNRKPFEDLPAGRILTPDDPKLSDFPFVDEPGTVRQIVIDMRSGTVSLPAGGMMMDLGQVGAMISAARAAPALSSETPVLSANRESWVEMGTGNVHPSATAALEFGRLNGTIAIPVSDLDQPVALAGVM